MSHIIEKSWQLEQLTALSVEHPDLVQGALDLLWQHFPSLHREITMAAVADGRLTVGVAAESLVLTEDEVIIQSVAYKNQRLRKSRLALVECEAGRAARLPGSSLPVWEVIKEFRKHGPAAVLKRFPVLTQLELDAAISFAETHSDEIDRYIREYEEYQESKTRASVPNLA